MSQNPWTPFYFDGNAFFGMIETPEKWKEALEAYADRIKQEPGFLKRAKVYPRSLKREIIVFGFYSEHTGPLTLGEWAAQQGMSLD